MSRKMFLVFLVSLCCVCVDGWSRPVEEKNLPEATRRHLEKYNFSWDEFTENIPVWERVLKEFKGRPQVHYLEIGVFEGLSAFWTLDNILTHPTSRLTAVDVFPMDLKERFLANLAISGQAEKVSVITGFSQVELRHLPLAAFDIIYIDGSHTADDCLTDAILSWSLLKRGGILIFDDYSTLASDKPIELTPTLAIDSFITCFRRFMEIVERNDDQVIIRKTRELQNDEKYFWQRTVIPVGQYLFDSASRKLVYAETREQVELKENEGTLLNELLKSRAFGETEFSPEILQSAAFKRLAQRLELDLGN